MGGSFKRPHHTIDLSVCLQRQAQICFDSAFPAQAGFFVVQISDSVKFTSQNSRKLFGLTVLKNNHRDIRRLRKEAGYPSHHGNKVWNASLLLMDYFKEQPLEQGSRVLEIGCGWGITGIYCAKRFNCEVTGLDIDASVFPFMHHHALINGVRVDTVRCSYQRATQDFLAQYDVVVGGDICFWDELSTPLFNLLRRAHRMGNRVVLSDPGRPPFQLMAERAQHKLGGEFEGWAVPEPYNCSGYILDVPGL